MNYQQKYEQLLAEFEQYKKESIKWSVEDFLIYNEQCADECLYITAERAQEALWQMIRKHDAEWGISWQEVEFYFREYADKLQLDLMLENIEIANYNNLFNIYYNSTTSYIHAIEIVEDDVIPMHLVYCLTDDIEIIAKRHRQEILEYCLATVLSTDSVGLGDIFVHGKYIKRII